MAAAVVSLAALPARPAAARMSRRASAAPARAFAAPSAAAPLRAKAAKAAALRVRAPRQTKTHASLAEFVQLASAADEISEVATTCFIITLVGLAIGFVLLRVEASQE